MAGLSVANVIKVYKTGTLEVVALQGVSFTADVGQLVVIRGPSGSGKSTLLTLVAGLDKPTAGSIRVEGADVEKLEGRDLDRYLLTTVGIVFQNFNLISAFSTAENVMFPMLLAGKSRFEARGRALDLLGEVGMEDRTDHTPSELSGGEQQRVAVAVALANDPAVILADEPTAELDSKTGQFVVEKLRNQAHRQKKLVVVATHDDTIAALADRVVRLQDGRIHESGLKASPNH